MVPDIPSRFATPCTQGTPSDASGASVEALSEEVIIRQAWVRCVDVSGRPVRSERRIRATRMSTLTVERVSLRKARQVNVLRSRRSYTTSSRLPDRVAL